MKSMLASRFALIGMTTIAFGMGVSQAYATTLEDGVPSTVVRYQDLDLSQPRDAQRLYQRIQTAARLVCDDHQFQSLGRMPAYHACIDQAVTRAVDDVRSSQVTQIHQAETQHVANRS